MKRALVVLPQTVDVDLVTAQAWIADTAANVVSRNATGDLDSGRSGPGLSWMLWRLPDAACDGGGLRVTFWMVSGPA